MTKASTKITSYSVSSNFQKAFICLGVSVVLVQILISAYHAIAQFPFNPNLSAYLSIALDMLVIPLVLFTIPFLLSQRRKISLVNRLFEATFFTVMAGLALMVLSSLVFFVQGAMGLVLDSYSVTLLVSYSPTIVFIFIYAALVVRYSRGRR